MAGPTHWERIAGRMGLRYVMLVDAAGRVYMTPDMTERIRFRGQSPEVVTAGQAE